MSDSRRSALPAVVCGPESRDGGIVPAIRNKYKEQEFGNQKTRVRCCRQALTWRHERSALDQGHESHQAGLDHGRRASVRARRAIPSPSPMDEQGLLPMHSHTIEPWRHHHAFLGAAHERNERRTWFVVLITTLMMVAEIVGGGLYGSMALVADGWHMATHVAALAIAAFAYRFARRHVHDPRFS